MQRCLYGKEELEQERMKRLDHVGFDWSLSPAGVCWPAAAGGLILGDRNEPLSCWGNYNTCSCS
jgi:hypothetical protein